MLDYSIKKIEYRCYPKSYNRICIDCADVFEPRIWGHLHCSVCCYTKKTLFDMVLYCALTALIEEPATMIIMEKSSDASSIQGSFSASAKHVASKMQETSFSSTSMSDVKFESMSASSMSSMSSEAMMAMSSSSMMAMSSSSMMAMSSHSHVEGSSIRAISRGLKGEMDTHSVHLCIKHLKRRTVKHQQTCMYNTTKIYFFPVLNRHTTKDRSCSWKYQYRVRKGPDRRMRFHWRPNTMRRMVTFGEDAVQQRGERKVPDRKFSGSHHSRYKWREGDGCWSVHLETFQWAWIRFHYC